MKKFKYISVTIVSLFMIFYIAGTYIKSISIGKAQFTAQAAEANPSESEIENNIEQGLLDNLKYKNELLMPAENPVISATEGIIMDLKANRVLYNKNAYSQMSMASTTKIMTFIVAIENCEDIQEIVTISKNASDISGSTMHLAEGETIPMECLLYGLMLNSGNDAAVAIAEHISGDIEAFAELMNKKALSIGALNSSFKTPHGLDAKGHYTTAYDLSIISKEAYKIPLFREIIGTKNITLNGHYLKNTNPLLGAYDYVTGGKTGYTSSAGKCLVFFIEKDNLSAVCVILGCPTSNERITDGVKLLKYTVENYNSYKAFDKGANIDSFPIEKGLDTEVDGIVDEALYITLAKWEEASLYVSYIRYEDILTAPVKKSMLLGRLCIGCLGYYFVYADVVADNFVLRKSYENHLTDMIETFPYLMV